MRAKKAKQLRSIANYACKRGLEQTTYIVQTHKPKLISTGKLNANGTPEVIRYIPETVKLGECVRKIYKQLKQAA